MDDSHDAMLDVLLDEQASTRSLVHEAGVAVDYLSTYRHLQSDLSKLAQTMALHLAEELHTTHEEYDDQYPLFPALRISLNRALLSRQNRCWRGQNMMNRRRVGAENG